MQDLENRKKKAEDILILVGCLDISVLDFLKAYPLLSWFLEACTELEELKKTIEGKTFSFCPVCQKACHHKEPSHEAK